jgi:transcriptional regulator GlxA family with amidase domain
MTTPVRFAILIYDGVEPIDIGATYGVLSMARRIRSEIEMLLVAEQPGPVVTANDLTVMAHRGFDDCPPADVLIVTGGPGWSRQCENERVLRFIRDWSRTPALLASVCTGGMILAAAGVLDGHRATTKREVYGTERPPLDVMAERHPDIATETGVLVDDGKVVTGGGVSLAMDVTLYLIDRLCGADVGRETARIIEYAAAREANRQRFA